MEERIDIVWDPTTNQYVVSEFRHGERVGYSYVRAGDSQRVSHLEVAMWIQNRSHGSSHV